MDKYIIKRKISSEETEREKETEKHLNKKVRNDAQGPSFYHGAEPGQSTNKQHGHHEGMDDDMTTEPSDDVPLFILNTEDEDAINVSLNESTNANIAQHSDATTTKSFNNGPPGEFIKLLQ